MVRLESLYSPNFILCLFLFATSVCPSLFHARKFPWNQLYIHEHSVGKNSKANATIPLRLESADLHFRIDARALPLYTKGRLEARGYLTPSLAANSQRIQQVLLFYFDINQTQPIFYTTLSRSSFTGIRSNEDLHGRRLIVLLKFSDAKLRAERLEVNTQLWAVARWKREALPSVKSIRERALPRETWNFVTLKFEARQLETGKEVGVTGNGAIRLPIHLRSYRKSHPIIQKSMFHTAHTSTDQLRRYIDHFSVSHRAYNPKHFYAKGPLTLQINGTIDLGIRLKNGYEKQMRCDGTMKFIYLGREDHRAFSCIDNGCIHIRITLLSGLVRTSKALRKMEGSQVATKITCLFQNEIVNWSHLGIIQIETGKGEEQGFENIMDVALKDPFLFLR